ncbi:hypothetical protein VNO77_39091 [Canavalia gladiata]|uniref:Uncharacterized protein n=1 Tax=Canavalia gladiata TaxID=3824 RepID=A0AAN9KAF7_CANGL
MLKSWRSKDSAKFGKWFYQYAPVFMVKVTKYQWAQIEPTESLAFANLTWSQLASPQKLMKEVLGRSCEASPEEALFSECSRGAFRGWPKININYTIKQGPNSLTRTLSPIHHVEKGANDNLKFHLDITPYPYTKGDVG